MKKTRVWVECLACGNKVERKLSLLTPRKYGSFCDKDCLGKFRSKFLINNLAANFKEGAAKDRKYIKVQAPWHPHKADRDYVYLHRIVAEARMGRFLKDKEIVHHKDGNQMNNHWENLEVMTQSEHIETHRKEMLGRRNELFHNKKGN